jgi:pregnancy-associated plasma protein-A/type IX secretion system substrate protein
MKIIIFGIAALLAIGKISGQSVCSSFEYQQLQLKNDPGLIQRITEIEKFSLAHQDNINSYSINARTTHTNVFKIPIVVHVLYHTSYENISDLKVKSQINALNRDFRKINSDTSKIPVAFKLLAADCEIEFELAKVDPKGRATNGIIHKYTPITSWNMDDKIKFSSEMGDDSWDSKTYLNIWVGNVRRLLGYSTFPGGAPEKDGIVMNLSAMGTLNTAAPYNMGRTAVHEIGHWLGLKHLWGDTDCGDDLVNDTPKQSGFTTGCPISVRISCDNNPAGDMYMNYMDFTNDACLNMFTTGQKQRMRALFAVGGARHSILFSNALGTPSTEEIPLPDAPPKWLFVKLFPNPATSELTINLEYDPRWVGKEFIITNLLGQVAIKKTISSKITKIDISRLKPGLYFINATRNGEKLREKFVKIL